MMQAEAARETRKQETRARILKAAAELYLARGLDGVSIDEVARAAERTKGAVYGHFADKEALLLEVWRAHYSQKRALIEAALARSGDPATMARELERAMTAVFALGPWSALAVDVRRRAEYSALASELAALEQAETAALTAHFVRVRDEMGLAAVLAPNEIASTLFALAEGLLLRGAVAPDIAAARFMAVLLLLINRGAPP